MPSAKLSLATHLSLSILVYPCLSLSILVYPRLALALDHHFGLEPAFRFLDRLLSGLAASSYFCVSAPLKPRSIGFIKKRSTVRLPVLISTLPVIPGFISRSANLGFTSL